VANIVHIILMEHITNILFIDIETVPLTNQYDTMSDIMKKEWVRKSKNIKQIAEAESDPNELFFNRAGVYSEFAKVICIGIGGLVEKDKTWHLRLKSLRHDDEKILLQDFVKLLQRWQTANKSVVFCGHNIKEFDIPFICRRLIINQIPLPDCLNLAGKKPWEVTHLDTMEMWRFGDYKNFTSLSLLAEVLGIPSPKTDIDGSMVAQVYYEQGDLNRIAHYCQQDVLTSAKVYLKLAGFNHIDPQPIFVTE